MSKLKPKDFNAPAILLGGPVDYDMYKDFRAQLDRSTKEGLVVTELSTLGGKSKGHPSLEAQHLRLFSSRREANVASNRVPCSRPHRAILARSILLGGPPRRPMSILSSPA